MKKITIAISTMLLCCRVSNPPDQKEKYKEIVSQAKMTVQKAFLYSFKEEYDSLRLIMPDLLFKNAGKGDLNINFKDFKRVVEIDGLPDTTNIILESVVDENLTDLVFKFIPVSKDSLLIDSVKFVFVGPLGAKRIWKYEFFSNHNPFDNIKTISPK